MVRISLYKLMLLYCLFGGIEVMSELIATLLYYLDLFLEECRVFQD